MAKHTYESPPCAVLITCLNLLRPHLLYPRMNEARGMASRCSHQADTENDAPRKIAGDCTSKGTNCIVVFN
jgi:hypothetical protein